MAKTIEPVTGQTGEYADYNGKYVDYIFSKEQKDEITTGEGTHFFDPTIIPTVQYQVYGLDNVWFWDNEGQNYTFDQEGTKSTIEIQISDGVKKTYYMLVYEADIYKLNELDEPTKEQMDEAEGPIDLNDQSLFVDENINKIYYADVEQLDPAEPEEIEPYEFNKYGKAKMYGDILVTITPAQDLVERFPYAIVTINGKEHDLNYLNEPIRLYMDRDYRISINWVWGSIVETFRIICNR